MREVVDWRGVDLHAAPLRERVASTGGHPSRGDREFAPSDTQEFSLPLQKAGEFKVYGRFHRDRGTATLKVR